MKTKDALKTTRIVNLQIILKTCIATMIIATVSIASATSVHADQFLDDGIHEGSGCSSGCTMSVTCPDSLTHWTNLGSDITSVATALNNSIQWGWISPEDAQEMLQDAIDCVGGGGGGDSGGSHGSIIMTIGTTCNGGGLYYNNVNAQWAQANKNNPANDVGFDRNQDAGNGKTVQDLMDEGAQQYGDAHGFVCANKQDDEEEEDTSEQKTGGRCPDTVETASAANSATGKTTIFSPCSSGTCETADDTTARFLHTFSFIPGCHGGACSSGSVTPPAVTNSCFAPLGSGCSQSASATYPSTAHFQQIVHYRELWHTEHYSCHCSTDSEGHRSCSTCSRRVFDGCEESGRSPWQWTGDSGTSSVSTSGSVINPYKYRLEPKSDDPESDHVYTGEKTTIGGEVTNYPGPNQNKNTHTYSYRKTLVRLVEFTVAPDKSSDGVPGGTGADPCNFFKNRYYDGQVWECNTVWEQTRKIAPNETVKHSEVRNIPDTKPLGTKYCYAIGAYTIDSGNNGMGNPPSDSWVVSGASCTTISKKPNFQIWNSGVYTNGSIVTSLSPKTIGGGFAPNDDSTKTIFGSWEEQIAIVGGTAAGFASGNTLGYSNYTFTLPGGIGYNSQLTVNRKYQPISPLTISNTGNEIGNSKITALPTALLSRLNARYHPENEEVKGDFTYHGDNLYNGTKVIYSTGTVTIDKDICYGSCDSNHNINTNQVIALNQQSLSSSAISDLPQILIFAKNINITGNVERLDAWLIAEDTINTCSGFKSNDTEAGFNNGVSAGFNTASCNRQLITNGPIFAKHLALNRTAGAYNGGGTSEPDDVRGQNLSNDGSITPAEIFNLRPDTYLWAYSQAQDFTEAVVTYSRELAPRL